MCGWDSKRRRKQPAAGLRAGWSRRRGCWGRRWRRYMLHRGVLMRRGRLVRPPGRDAPQSVVVTQGVRDCSRVGDVRLKRLVVVGGSEASTGWSVSGGERKKVISCVLCHFVVFRSDLRAKCAEM
jgi:hypothetical protein